MSWQEYPCDIRTYRLSREIWIERNGPIPTGFYVCHWCNEGTCWTLEHFYLDTQSGNLKYAYSSNRRVSPSTLPGVGEKISRAKTGNTIAHPRSGECLREGYRQWKSAGGIARPRAKLTYDLAEEIRQRYRDEDISQHRLSLDYNVTEETIRLVIIRSTWTKR